MSQVLRRDSRGRFCSATSKKVGGLRVTPVLTNKVILLLDDSGSMASIANQALTAFNNQVETLQSESRKTGQKTEATIAIFGESTQFLTLEANPAFISPLTRAQYRAMQGETRLLDAIGDALTRVQDDGTSSYLLIVVTDGGENRSSRFSKSDIVRMLEQRRNTDRWSFVGLVPPGDRTLETWGFPAGNIQEWERTTSGVSTMNAQTTAGISGYYATRASGQTSTQRFFTNATHITQSDLNRLRDVSGDFVELKVTQTVQLNTFVDQIIATKPSLRNAMGNEFQIGRSYYELTKPETIQGTKDLVIRDKNTGMMYGGSEARQLLGLPAGEVKVRPGDHGKFDIFVKSTSNNRKLIVGQRLLYRRQ